MRTRREPKTVEITVTAEDIQFGKRSSAAFCPIARATKRAFPTLRPAVGLHTINLYGEEGHFYMEGYNLPEEATNFIMKFDQHEEVSPFTFKATKI